MEAHTTTTNHNTLRIEIQTNPVEVYRFERLTSAMRSAEYPLNYCYYNT